MKLDAAQAAPEPIVTLFTLKFAPDVPALKSSLRTKALVRNEHQERVPLATAFALVIAFTVRDPADAAAANAAEHGRVASNTCAPSAVSESVGCVLSYQRITGLEPSCEVSPSSAMFRIVTAVFGFRATL